MVVASKPKVLVDQAEKQESREDRARRLLLETLKEYSAGLTTEEIAEKSGLSEDDIRLYGSGLCREKILEMVGESHSNNAGFAVIEYVHPEAKRFRCDWNGNGSYLLPFSFRAAWRINRDVGV